MSAWFEEGVSIDMVPVEDRAFQYGDGLFETIAVRGGNLRLFATAVEARDGYTEIHCERLAAFSVAVAERLRVGQQVQFHLRDGQTSRQELSQLLARQRLRQPQPLAALLRRPRTAQDAFLFGAAAGQRIQAGGLGAWPASSSLASKKR